MYRNKYLFRSTEITQVRQLIQASNLLFRTQFIQFHMFNGLNFLGLACTWEVRGFETKSLQSRNSYFDHSISIHGLTQIRHVALYWFKGRSLHVLNWSRGIRFGIFELGLWYSMWSLFHCFNVGDHDFEFRNIISGQHFNNLGDSLR